MLNSKYALVEFYIDYVCTQEIYGFQIILKDDWEKDLEWVKNNIRFPFEMNLSDWEEVIFPSYEKYLKSYTITELDEVEVKILNKFFPDGYGRFFKLDKETVEYYADISIM